MGVWRSCICRQAPDFIRVRVRRGDLVWSLSNLQSDGLLKGVADGQHFIVPPNGNALHPYSGSNW